MDKFKPISRRTWLKSCAAGITGIGALSLLGSRFALADGSSTKTAKSAVQYQNSPKDGKRCGHCRFFIPPKGSNKMADGTCQLVAGKINPMGYCILFNAA